jgi:hypothetical protein
MKRKTEGIIWAIIAIIGLALAHTYSLNPPKTIHFIGVIILAIAFVAARYYYIKLIDRHEN